MTSFEAQTVTVSELGLYDHFLVEVRSDSNQTSRTMCFALKSIPTNLVGFDYDNKRYTLRKITIDESSFVVTTGKGSWTDSTNISWSVPTRIWGVK